MLAEFSGSILSDASLNASDKMLERVAKLETILQTENINSNIKRG